jgi:Dolichyl-phosphate-mannose-protein mannosyltransferase
VSDVTGRSTGRSNIFRRLEIVASVLLLAAAARFVLMFFHRGANLLDEGSQVAMANRILHGDVIYRDFLSVAAPGSFYTVAWLFQLFGAELMVVRWAVFVLILGTAIVTFIIARQLMSWPFAAASALLTIVWGWFLVAPNLYSLEAMFFALVALACYLRAEHTSRTWLFLAGVACGAAMMTKQNTGLYAAIALSLSLWISLFFESPSFREAVRERRTRRRLFVAGIALVLVPALLYLITIGAGPHLYENWVYYPLQLYPRGLTFEYPAFYPLGDDVWQKLVLYLPWLVYPFAVLALAVFGVRKLAATGPAAPFEGHALLAVTVFGALTFLQAFPRADMTHILFGMQPAFILLGYLCFTCSQLFGIQKVPVLGYAVAVLFLMPPAVLIREGYNLTYASYQTEYVPLTIERARGIRTNMRNAAEIDQVSRYLQAHTRPEDPIFVVPWAAGFYFLADRPNPTRFDVLLYADPDVYPCLINTLDERKPAYVVYGYAWDVDGRRFSEYAQPIDDYIRTHYQVAERFDEYEIWRRSETAEPVFNDSPGACRRRVPDSREFRRLWRQLRER